MDLPELIKAVLEVDRRQRFETKLKPPSPGRGRCDNETCDRS
jgi:hypothetical protein